MDKSFFSIYKIFFKVGILLLGGGYVILPLLTSELSEKKNWLKSDELCEYYAISTSMPGVIAINTAIFTGRKLAGLRGEIAATAGIVTPSFLVIVLIASILEDIVHFKCVEYLLWGVGIGIITLLFLAIKEMWNKCVVDKYCVFVYSIALGVALFTKIPPAWIIIAAMVFGLIYEKSRKIRRVNDVE